MPVQTAEELSRKACQPCEGGVRPYGPDEARSQLETLEGWSLTEDVKKIVKTWKLADFAAAIRVVQDIARIAEDDGHHPDIHVEGYNGLRIELSTHAIGGLSENDFILAAKIDRAAP